MIGKLLSSAVKLYLRSQVEGIEDLQVKIEGKSKQILQGYIPQVSLSCDRVVYQGLHLSRVQLKGTNIAVNLPEVLKHKPLKLLEAVFVELQLSLDAGNLQASLDSTLLQSGLSDLWDLITQDHLDSQKLNKLRVAWQTVAIANNQLNFAGSYQNALGESKELALSTGIDLTDAHTLCLSSLNITNDLHSGKLERQLEIDLGTDVTLEELTIKSEQIFCLGKIKINN